MGAEESRRAPMRYQNYNHAQANQTQHNTRIQEDWSVPRAPVPGVGAKGSDKILEIREAKEDLELEELSQVSYLRLTHS